MNSQANKIPVSIFVVTQDEEKNIERLMSSLTRFSEVVVVDSGSTDNTLNIAKKYGAKIFHQEWLGYSKQKQFAMSLCENDWVLNLDADEALSSKLVDEISNFVKQEQYQSARINRKDVFIEKLPPEIVNKPSNIRLYRKSLAEFDDTKLVHESASVKGKQKKLKESFDHYGYDNVEVLVEKNNLYSSLKAKEKFRKGKKPSVVKLMTIFPLEFIRKYFFQRYIFFGVRGVILSVIKANYAFIKEAKLFEYHLRKKDN